MVILEAIACAAGTGGGVGLCAGAASGGLYTLLSWSGVDSTVDEVSAEASAKKGGSARFRSRSAASAASSISSSNSGAELPRRKSLLARRGVRRHLCLEAADTATTRLLARLLTQLYFTERTTPHCATGALWGVVCGSVCAAPVPLCAAATSAVPLGAAAGCPAGCIGGAAGVGLSEATDDTMSYIGDVTSLSAKELRTLKRRLSSQLADAGYPDKSKEIRGIELEGREWAELLLSAQDLIGRAIARKTAGAGKKMLASVPRSFLEGSASSVVCGATPVAYSRQNEVEVVPWVCEDSAAQCSWLAEHLAPFLPNPKTNAFARTEKLTGEWVMRKGTKMVGGRPDALMYVIYFHGGAYVSGSKEMCRRVTYRLCVEAERIAVLSISYRLAPRHVWPAQLVDGLVAYRSLAEAAPDKYISLAGDSAGGHLAATTVLAAHRLGLRRPTAAILLSPWLDLSPRVVMEEQEEAELLLPLSRMEEVIHALLCGEDQSADIPPGLRIHPLVSPVCIPPESRQEWGLADHAFPQCWTSVGDSELLRADAEAWVEKLPLGRAFPALSEGLEIGVGMPHVWQMLPDKVPQGRQSLFRIARWLRGTVEDVESGDRAATCVG